jgi:hypothetical protein
MPKRARARMYGGKFAHLMFRYFFLSFLKKSCYYSSFEFIPRYFEISKRMKKSVAGVVNLATKARMT